MVHKTYDSSLYIAQQFRNTIIKDPGNLMTRKYGFKFANAEHHGDTVKFNLVGIESHVSFKIQNKKVYAHLDMKLRNGDDVERIKEASIEMKIKRSKTGRISGDYFPSFFGDFVLKNIRAFHKEWYSVAS